MAEQRQLIYKILLEAGNSSKDAKKLAAEIDKVTNSANAAAAANQKMGEAVGKNSEVIFGSINHLKNQISGLKQQRDAVAVGSQEFVNYNSKIATLESQLKQASAATDIFNKSQKEASVQTKELAKLQTDQARSAGLAGATAFELGRTVSDLPFGLVAVSNNISQMGTLFAALTVNAKGLGNAFKLLWAQMMGPAGILIAFQIVVAAMTFFTQRSNKAKKAARDFSSELRGEAAALEVVSEQLSKGNLALEERLDILERYGVINKKTREDLDAIGLSEERQNELILKRNELIDKTLALEAARSAASEGKTLEDLRKEGLEELDKFETKINNERKRRLDELAVLVRKYGTEEETAAKTRAVINNNFDEQIEKNAESIAIANAKILAASKGEAELKGEIFDIEKSINAILEDRIDLEDRRRKSLSDLLSTQEDAEQAALDEAILHKNEQDFRNHFARLFEIRKTGLEIQRREELRGVTDTTVINAVEAKYKLLFQALNKELSQGFILGLKQVSGELDKIDDIVGERLGGAGTTLDQLAEGRKILLSLGFDFPSAEEMLKQGGVKAIKDFQKLVKESPKFRDDGSFDFLSTFGISEQRISEIIDVAQQGLATIGDIFASQAERDVTIETNKTNAINDQLRIRLANEQMSADERDKINQQIARNEAELVAKENAINKKRFDQEKAVNIATAVMNTFAAATGVLKDTKGGTFARIAGMIAVITAGLANVAMISRQQFQSRAMPNPRLTGLGESESGGPSFNVVGASSQNQLAQVIAAQNATPIKTFVVSSDVSSAQELDRKIIEGASI